MTQARNGKAVDFGSEQLGAIGAMGFSRLQRPANARQGIGLDEAAVCDAVT